MFIVVDKFSEQFARDDVPDPWHHFDTPEAAHAWAKLNLPEGTEYRVHDVNRPLDRGL